MRIRLITGIILAAILIPLLFLQTLIFLGVIGVFACIATYEFYTMVNKTVQPLKLYISFALLTLTLFVVVALSFLGHIDYVYLMVSMMALLLLSLSAKVFFQSYKTTYLMQGSLYIALPFASLAYIHSEGVLTLVYLLILAMLTDIFAYFVGVRFGKHKLAPAVSPKKTIEGSLGGTLIAVSIATPYAIYFNLFNDTINVGILIIAGILISFLAQIGDLVASAFKRQFDIKDFSNLLPGHGGVLDRFDSTMFASVVLAIFLLLTEVM